VLAVGGFQYSAGALVLDRNRDPEPTTSFDPCGRVGIRVPHRWLKVEHTRSTIDLAGRGWAILTRSQLPSVPLQDSDPRVDIRQVDGIDFLDHHEVLLLRPDHIIAWRGTRLDNALNALRTILKP
jgi:putative polyketide hydroxylase